MTIKQKFSSIDQSKLTADQKAFLTKIKDVTKNFTDAEMNKKVQAPLDGFIEKAKEKMPEAIKSAPVKRTAKAKTSQTRKPKRTAMSLAKEIRKQGETWKDAQARASKMMKEDSKDLSKTVETELDKLSKLVRSQKSRAKLSGLSGTDIKRDAVRKAKPRGRRTVTRSGETTNKYGTFTNKVGRKYTENRDNRTDRLAPKYPKNAPLLADGGYLTDPNFGNFQAGVYAGGGSVTNERRYVNKGEDYEVRYSKPILRRKGYQGKRDFELGGVMATDLAGYTGGGDAGLNAGMPLDGFSNTSYTGLVGETGAMSSGEMFMAGGSVGNFDVKLLVGKRVVYEAKVDTLKKAQRIGTEILSWGDDGFEYTIIGYDSSNNKIFENKRLLSDEFPDRLKDKFATLKLNVIVANPKQNKLDAGSFTTYKSLLNIVDDFEEANFRVTINGKTFYDDYELGGGLPSGAEQSYMITESFGTPAQHYAKGGGVRQVGNREYSYGRNWTNDHRHVNKGEDHEVKYTRKGKFLGVFDDGGKVEFVEKFTMKDGIQVSKGKSEDGKVFYSATITSYPLHKMIPMNEDKQYVVNRAKKIYSNMLEYKKSEQFENKDYQEKFYDSRKKLATGGAIKNQYEGRSEKDIWDNLTKKQRYHFLADHSNEFPTFKNDLYELLNEEYDKLPIEVEISFNHHVMRGQYNKGGALTNERLHVNHDEDYEVRYAKPRPSRKGYKGARKFMAGGMNNETPKIYVADLEAYNNGKLVGEYLDLADYNDADELMDAIQDVLKKSGGEEYAIHDYENFPSSMYSEYMGKRDFEQIYEMMDLAKQNNLPLEVVQDVVSQYGEGGVEEFVGKYDSAEDFAYEQVEEVGLENFSSPEYYVYITDTDRRIIAGEMADSYVDDIRDEDGGNRVIEEARMDVSEYEDADSDRQEEMLNEAVEIVRDEYYDQIFDELADPYNYFVDEQGMYSPDDFFKASFISVDYEKLGRDLDQDYTFIEYDGDLYVFNIR
jgi:antirestriction protein